MAECDAFLQPRQALVVSLGISVIVQRAAAMPDAFALSDLPFPVNTGERLLNFVSGSSSNQK